MFIYDWTRSVKVVTMIKDLWNIIHSFNWRKECHMDVKLCRAHIMCCAAINLSGCRNDTKIVRGLTRSCIKMARFCSKNFILYLKYGVILPECAKTITTMERVVLEVFCLPTNGLSAFLF